LVNPLEDSLRLSLKSFSLADELELGGSGSGCSGDGKIAVIGDDVEADLGEGAVELGLWRVVKTGKFRPGDEKRLGLQPLEEVHDSFAFSVDSFLETIFLLLYLQDDSKARTRLSL